MAPRAPSSLIPWVALAIAVVGLVIAASWIASWIAADGADPALRVASADGVVRVQRGDTTLNAGAGTPLLVDDSLRTSEGGGAVLLAGGEAEIRVGPDTTLQVKDSTAERVSIELDRGRVVADVPAGGRSVQIANQGRVVTAREAEVAVAVDQGLFSFEVRRGEVLAEGVDGVDVARAPSAVSQFPDGTVHLGEIPEELVLDVDWPAPRTREPMVVIRGRTSPGARVVIEAGTRFVGARAGPDGRFQVTVSLAEGVVPVVARVEDPFGRTIQDGVTLELDTRPPVVTVGQGP